MIKGIQPSGKMNYFRGLGRKTLRPVGRKISSGALNLTTSIILPTLKVTEKIIRPEGFKAETLIKILELSRIYDFFAEGIYIIDLDSNVLYANRAARRLFDAMGAKDAESPYPLAKVLTKDSLDEVIKRIAFAKPDDPKRDLYLELKKTDGTTIPIKTTPRIIEFKNGKYIVGTVTPSILSALMKLNEAITKTERTQDIFKLVLEYATNLFRVDACAFKTDFNVEDNSFSVPARKNLPQEYDNKRSAPLEESASYRAMKSGKIIFVEDLDERSSAAAEFGMKSGVFVPLRIRKGDGADGDVEYIGTFCLYTKEMKVFDSLKGKEQQLKMFAQFISGEISQARMRTKQIKRAERESALAKISRLITSSLEIEEVLDILVNEAKKVFDRDNKEIRGCSVYILDEGRNILIPMASVGRDLERLSKVKLGEGIIGVVAKKNAPIFSDDARETVENMRLPDGQRRGSFMVLPISADNKVIGVLNISSRERAYFDDEEDRKFVLSLSDIAGIALKNAQLMAKSKMLQMIDPLLSNLFNQGVVPNLLQNYLFWAKRYNRPLSVIWIDIDDFKNFNDQKGHLVADHELKKVAKILDRVKNFAAVPCRYGGEELLVIAPGFSKEHALQMAEQLREWIDDETEVTVSIGVSSYPSDAQEKEGLLHLSDRAMQKAKDEGKNKVIDAQTLPSQ